MTDDRPAPADGEKSEERRDLPPAARRAIAEAQARRRAEKPAERAPERGGPAGAEPTRYGDWERKGRAVDF